VIKEVEISLPIDILDDVSSAADVITDPPAN